MLLLFIFLRDVYTNDLSIKGVDDKQKNIFKKLGILNKGKRSSEKTSFLKNVESFLKQEKMFLIVVKVNYLQYLIQHLIQHQEKHQ